VHLGIKTCVPAFLPLASTALSLIRVSKMQCILFIHNNIDTPTTLDQWSKFFTVAEESGLFSN
jgi:hypothetical protein